MNTSTPSTKYWAWNPGLESQLPREYLPLSTIFRAENVSTTIAKAYEQATPLRRLGETDDVAGAVVFLSSPAGRFITGQTLVIDGGATIGGG